MTEPPENSLEQTKRTALERSGRLRFVHWWTVASLLLLSVVVWRFLVNQQYDLDRQEFDNEAHSLVMSINKRLATYEEALRSGAAAIEMLGRKPSRSEWRAFQQTMKLKGRYPGINGIGLIEHIQRDEIDAHLAYHRQELPDYTIHPEHPFDELFPIVYIEPIESNRAAVGLDMAHETHRREAARLATGTETAQVTGPIFLVQSDQKAPGFLLFVPFSQEQKEQSNGSLFVGMIYAPFVTRDLIDATVGPSDRGVSLRLTDENAITFDNIPIDYEPKFKRNITVPIYGRTWTYEIQSNAVFAAKNNDSHPVIILICGLCLSGLFLVMFAGMARANRKALALADQMTAAYKLKNKALKRSNNDLESFAAVASHDLRTPLRGIASLTEYIEEDLADYRNNDAFNPDVLMNLRRMRDRIQRLDQLLNGLLDYSSVGMHEDEWQQWSLQAFARQMRTEHNLTPEQLLVHSAPDKIFADTSRLKVVLKALVENAVHHHENPDDLTIVLRLNHDSEHYIFSVKDNGPGIDQRFQDKIFDAFETLSKSSERSNVGIGLAIARRTAESVGGSITFESELGFGATFSVLWPKNQQQKPEDQEELAA